MKGEGRFEAGRSEAKQAVRCQLSVVTSNPQSRQSLFDATKKKTNRGILLRPLFNVQSGLGSVLFAHHSESTTSSLKCRCTRHWHHRHIQRLRTQGRITVSGCSSSFFFQQKGHCGSPRHGRGLFFGRILQKQYEAHSERCRIL